MKLSPKAQASLNQVIQQFKAGDLSPIVEITRLHRKGDPVPFDGWSFCNRILAYIQSGSTDLRGYKQWRQVGRQVQKDTNGAFILVPCFKKDDDDEETIAYFKAVAVHPVENTTGDPLPESDYTPAQLPPLADVAQRLGVSVTWQPLPPGRLGQWSAVLNTIDLGTHDHSTFFHELAHAAHTRIDGPKKTPGQDPRREAIADFSACVLMHLYGLGDRTGNTWRYIQSYHKDPLTAITRALAKVEQVLQLILQDDATERRAQ